MQPKRSAAWIKAVEELEKHQQMLADTSNSDEESGDEIGIGAEIDEMSKDTDIAKENKSPSCKEVRVSLKRIAEPGTDRSLNGENENQNFSEDTTPFSVSRWLIAK